MFRIINEEVVRVGNQPSILYFVLDTSDFVVDILSDADLLGILQQGIAIEGINYNRYTGKIENIRLQGGLLPPKFRSFSIQNKVFLLELQKEGACLLPTEDFNNFYGTTNCPVEASFFIEVGKLITYTTYRNATRHMRFLRDYVFYVKAQGILGLMYDNQLSKVSLPLDLDMSVLDSSCQHQLSGDTSGILQSGGFTSVEYLSNTNGCIGLNIFTSNGGGVQLESSFDRLGQFVFSNCSKTFYPWSVGVVIVK